MVNLRPSTRPDSRESEDGDWRQQRDSIKKGSFRAISRAEPQQQHNAAEAVASLKATDPGLLKAPQELPPLRLTRSISGKVLQKTDSANACKAVEACNEVCTEAKRIDFEARHADVESPKLDPNIAAKAQSSACWEDLISFLEMHKLPGAYALAFSAFGIEDLSSLLLLDDAQLSSLLEKCSIDAMDEILLLEALRSSRPFN